MHNKYILNVYLGEAPIPKKNDSIWQKSDLINNVKWATDKESEILPVNDKLIT